jgi:hypothetical protein
VRAVLADAGLALRDQVRIARVDRGVHVDGTVASATTRRALSARLGALPLVHMTLRPPPQVVAPAAIGGSDVHDPARAVAVVTARLVALDDLARAYPVSASAQLSPEARLQLQRVIAGHFGALGAELDVLRVRWERIVGTAEHCPIANTPADWRQRVTVALRLIGNIRSSAPSSLSETTSTISEQSGQRPIRATLTLVLNSLGCQGG